MKFTSTYFCITEGLRKKGKILKICISGRFAECREKRAYKIENQRNKSVFQKTRLEVVEQNQVINGSHCPFHQKEQHHNVLLLLLMHHCSFLCLSPLLFLLLLLLLLCSNNIFQNKLNFTFQTIYLLLTFQLKDQFLKRLFEIPL